MSSAITWVSFGFLFLDPIWEKLGLSFGLKGKRTSFFSPFSEFSTQTFTDFHVINILRETSEQFQRVLDARCPYTLTGQELPKMSRGQKDMRAHSCRRLRSFNSQIYQFYEKGIWRFMRRDVFLKLRKTVNDFLQLRFLSNDTSYQDIPTWETSHCMNTWVSSSGKTLLDVCVVRFPNV